MCVQPAVAAASHAHTSHIFSLRLPTSWSICAAMALMGRALPSEPAAASLAGAGAVLSAPALIMALLPASPLGVTSALAMLLPLSEAPWPSARVALLFEVMPVLQMAWALVITEKRGLKKPGVRR